jgi:folate-binding protein YgfZ
MLSRGLGGLEQSLLDHCEALLLERHPVHALVHPRAAIRPALEHLPLASLAELRNVNEWDPLAVRRLRHWLRATAPAVVLTIGRRASVLARRARRRLPGLPQVGATPNYSLGPLVGLDHVLATTEDLRRALLAAGQPAERVTIVPNLVRPPPAVVVRPPQPDAVPVIGALGRLVPKKGFADLLEALGLLAAQGYGFQAWIGGNGPEAKNLKALSAHLHLSDQVRFLGWVEDKRAFFEALDLFCVPSREEPFGIVALEAMAHGRATIATDAAGPREIIRDGADGLLMPRSDPRALAAAIAGLLDHPERRRALAEAGLETVRARFALPVVARQISTTLCAVAGTGAQPLASPNAGTNSKRAEVGGSRALEMSDGYVLLPERGVLAVRGADAVAFLQGLISSDLHRITAEQAGYGALLTPQGKFLFDFIMICAGDQLLLDTERPRLGQLLQRLTMYRLRSKVELEDVSGRWSVAAVLGEGAASCLDLPHRPGACRALADGFVLVDPRLARLGVRVLLQPDQIGGALEGLGLARLEPDAYEQARLALGVPDGSRDLVVDRSTLLESGFEELHGVDFAKGCFVGQELTARMHYRGLVRKRLLPVVLKGPRPEPGTIIRLGEREAGEMRSSIDGRGLALLRLDRIAEAEQAAAPLYAGATEVLPVKPDWVNF